MLINSKESDKAQLSKSALGTQSQGHYEDRITICLWSLERGMLNPRRIPQCAKGLLNSQTK